jgi:hypothetical protein
MRLSTGVDRHQRQSGLLGITSYERSDMLNRQKPLERQELLRPHRELQAEIAQHERNLRDGDSQMTIRVC